MKVSLSEGEISVYDQSVKWWKGVREDMEAILQEERMGGTPKNLWRNYWSAHQRFFRELAICAKVQCVSEDALENLGAGKSVVVSF